MNRTEFLSLSVAIHAILIAAAFLMPAPFPSPKLPKYAEELLYVQPVNLEARPGEHHHAGKTAAAFISGKKAGNRESGQWLPAQGGHSFHPEAAPAVHPALPIANRPHDWPRNRPP